MWKKSAEEVQSKVLRSEQKNMMMMMMTYLEQGMLAWLGWLVFSFNNQPVSF